MRPDSAWPRRILRQPMYPSRGRPAGECSGAAVIAFERMFFPSGVQKRGGPRETTLNDIRLPTARNQLEAAMACSRNLPLMVIVEEGLLERGYDWYVQRVPLDTTSVNTNEFNGILASWKNKSAARPQPSAPGKEGATPSRHRRATTVKKPHEK